MKNALCITALLLMSAPAMAGDGHVPNSTLSELGLGGMQTVTDAAGLEVRGLSLGAASGGTSLVFGQLVGENDGSTIFVAGSDVNYAGASSTKYFGYSAEASHKQGSQLSLSLPGLYGSLSAQAGFAASDFAGIGYARAR